MTDSRKRRSTAARLPGPGGGAVRRQRTFPEALAALLRSRGLKVPPGLTKAPPDAYARQPAEVVEQLASLDDAALVAQAERIAGYARRRAERVREAWEQSPVLAEIRRRGLPEPPPPQRVVGASVSLKKPLERWTDEELLAAAREWSSRGRS